MRWRCRVRRLCGIASAVRYSQMIYLHQSSGAARLVYAAPSQLPRRRLLHELLVDGGVFCEFQCNQCLFDPVGTDFDDDNVVVVTFVAE